MKTSITLIVFACLFTLASCHSKERFFMEKDATNMSMAGSDVPPPPPSVVATHKEQNPARLIKKGEITIASNDIESTKSLIYKFVGECNGYVTSENMFKDEFFSRIEVSLNVQSSRFEVFLKLLDSAKINIVSSKFSVDDVSMRYVDDSTRLQNKRKLGQKYRDLLSRATNMKDLLDLEEKLDQIQTDIEVRENQLKMLDKQIAYSEFTVRIEKNAINLPYNARNKFTYRLGQGIIAGWEGAKSILIFLFAIWPFYVVVGIIFMAVKAIIKRRKK